MTNYDDNLRTVGEVAKLLGLSVRTLHHWEELGLVIPDRHSWSNYRLYSDTDITRLQQIMIYRAIGMSLEAIEQLIDNDDNQVEHLLRQRDLLIGKENELHKKVKAIEELLEDKMGKKQLKVEEVAQILEDADFPKHQTEAEQKWGETDDWAISKKTMSAMSQEDWQALKDKTSQVEEKLAAAMNNNVVADSAEANSLAEEHRELLSAYFPVSHAKHVLIARGYVNDSRFNKYYEKHSKGLATWLKAIIDENAINNGVDLENVTWE
ncbi:MAG: MerR family transcriptional regulator [Micrococcaceae bacterium]